MSSRKSHRAAQKHPLHPESKNKGWGSEPWARGGLRSAGALGLLTVPPRRLPGRGSVAVPPPGAQGRAYGPQAASPWALPSGQGVCPPGRPALSCLPAPSAALPSLRPAISASHWGPRTHLGPPAGQNYWTSERHGQVQLRLEKNSLDYEAPLTVHDMVMDTAIKYADYIALGSKHRNGWHTLTYIEYYEQCRRAAKAFLKVGPAPRLRAARLSAAPVHRTPAPARRCVPPAPARRLSPPRAAPRPPQSSGLRA
ncbi:hypothetical protein GHT09_013538 [Marmota monax]|uniref:Uncharacterized protein n=1 Tax=Marmota monax TaxID=9995 RepID=A0A834UZ08_MARMO|nr:hypothetical protein GHT09_013538 [Marmota monax]